MAVKDQWDKKKNAMLCQRCNGPMAFEKFYGENDSFFGWHCVICGDILDPVILLHRLSQDANLAIPEKEEETMALIEKYLRAKSQEIYPHVGRSGGKKHADKTGNIDSADSNWDKRAFPA